MISLSKLELAAACLHSFAVKLPPDRPGPAAAFGTEFHRLAARHLQGFPVRPGDEHEQMWAAFEPFAVKRYPRLRVDVEQAFAWDGQSRSLGHDIARKYRQKGAADTDICGSIDVWWTAGGVVRVDDWKTGRPYHAAKDSWQLRGAVVMLNPPPTQPVVASYVYVNARGNITVDEAEITPNAINETRRGMLRVRQDFVDGNTAPVAGDHCDRLYCPARKVCSAYKDSEKKKTKEVSTMANMTLKSITTGKQQVPYRVVLYGPEGIGKSTFAAGAPAPVFLGEHGGTAHLDVARFPAPEAWGDVFAALNELAGEHQFKTLVIDPLDGLEPLVWAHVCAEGGKKTIEDFGFGKGYVQAQAEFQRFLDALNMLSHAKGMNIIILAHSHVRAFRNPQGEDYDTYELKMHNKSAAIVRGWPDAVLFANYETFTRELDGRIKAVGDGSRIVHTEARPAFHAKNRYGLPFTLPLSWEDFDAAAKAGAPEAVAKLQKEIKAAIELLTNGSVEQAKGHLERAGDDPAKLAKLLDWTMAKLNIEKETAA